MRIPLNFLVLIAVLVSLFQISQSVITKKPSRKPTAIPSKAPSKKPTKVPIATVVNTLKPVAVVTIKPVIATIVTNRPFVSVPIVPGLNPHDWSTANFDQQRTGLNPTETTITTTSWIAMKRAWVFRTVGGVLSQPVVAIGYGGKNVAFFGDESGGFYAVNLLSGAQLWKTNLGGTHVTFCSDLVLGNFSITGTPVFDRLINTIYVVGGAGSFNALSMSTGAVLWSIPNFYQPQHVHNYGGLLLHNNIVYATFGGICDLNGVYNGGIYAVDTITKTSTVVFSPYQGTVGAYGGGIWGLGGATLGDMKTLATSSILTPTGNCKLTASESSNFCERIVKLDVNTLAVLANVQAPAGTKSDNDMGSSVTYFNGLQETQTSGCLRPLVAAYRKDGMYLVAFGDTLVQTQALQLGNPTGAGAIQQAAWDQFTNTLVVPQTTTAVGYVSSLIGFTLGANCLLTQKWATPLGSMSSPTIVGAPGARIAIVSIAFSMAAVNVQTGALISSKTVLGTAKNAPIAVNGTVLIGTVGNSLTQRALEAWR